MPISKNQRTLYAAAAMSVAVVVVVAGMAFYRTQNPPLDPPAEVVQNVLELRRERSADASAYAQYFANVEVAQMLAQDATATAANATATAGSPIPEWNRPYVSEQSSGTASVVVVWKRTPSFKEWAKATLFNLEGGGATWKIVDAEEISKSIPPPRGSVEETAKP